MSDRAALIERLRVGLMASAAFVRDSRSKEAQARMKDALDAFEEVSTLLSAPSSPVSGEGDDLRRNARANATRLYGALCEELPIDWVGTGNSRSAALGEKLARETCVAIIEAALLANVVAPSRPPEPAVSGGRKPVAWLMPWQSGLGFAAEHEHDKPGVFPVYRDPPGGDVRALREVLEPFARYTAVYGDAYRDDDVAIHNSITVGAIRRAASALALPVPDDETKRLRESVIEECAKAIEALPGHSRNGKTIEPTRQHVANEVRRLASPKPPVEGTKP